MNESSAESRRLAYLAALDVDVFHPRGVKSAAPADDEVRHDDSAIAGAADVEVPADWAGLREAVAGCRKCSLCETRTQTVFGVGSESADWMIIGEAPGAEEDRRGEPFVGRAGKLLDEMLRAIGLDRRTAFIANILKCRPPNNRDPSVEEAARCRAWLDRQIELVQPRIVLAVGRIAAQRLLDSDAPVGRMRGREYFLNDGQLPVVVTYHPAYLLRSPSQKRKVWQDLCLARKLIDA